MIEYTISGLTYAQVCRVQDSIAEPVAPVIEPATTSEPIAPGVEPVTTSEPIAPGVEVLDIKGLPWDERINAATKSKTKSGVWTRLRGIDDDIYNKTLFEIRQSRQNIVAEPVLAEPVLAEPTIITHEMMMNQVSVAFSDPTISFGPNDIRPLCDEFGIQTFDECKGQTPLIEAIYRRLGGV